MKSSSDLNKRWPVGLLFWQLETCKMVTNNIKNRNKIFVHDKYLVRHNVKKTNFFKFCVDIHLLSIRWRPWDGCMFRRLFGDNDAPNFFLDTCASFPISVIWQEMSSDWFVLRFLNFSLVFLYERGSSILLVYMLFFNVVPHKTFYRDLVSNIIFQFLFVASNVEFLRNSTNPKILRLLMLLAVKRHLFSAISNLLSHFYCLHANWDHIINISIHVLCDCMYSIHFIFVFPSIIVVVLVCFIHSSLQYQHT